MQNSDVPSSSAPARAAAVNTSQTVWYCNGGTWKRCAVWYCNGGTWRQCTVYYRNGNTWVRV